jgi:hypothetical protein
MFSSICAIFCASIQFKFSNRANLNIFSGRRQGQGLPRAQSLHQQDFCCGLQMQLPYRLDGLALQGPASAGDRVQTLGKGGSAGFSGKTGARVPKKPLIAARFGGFRGQEFRENIGFDW